MSNQESLDSELSKIEANLDEYDREMDGGKYTEEAIERQVVALADPNELVARVNAGDQEYMAAYKKELLWIGGIEGIDMLRLRDLKHLYPSDPRLDKICSRALKSYIRLHEINFAVSEKLVEPSIRPQVRAENQKALDNIASMYSNAFTVPSGSGGTEFTDVFFAASIGNVSDVMYFVERDAGVVRAFDDKGVSLLYRVAKYRADGDDEVFKYLVSKGADVNAQNRNKEGMTPIFVAVTCGKVETIKCLKELGADVNARDSDGLTPMFDAVTKADRVETIKCLAGLGADVNARSGMDGRTPMFFAAILGRTESIECLKSLGADIEAKDNDGLTPMFVAVGEGNVASIECLARLGVDVNVGSGGMTPAVMAAAEGKMEALKCLKRLGARMDVTAGNGMTLLDIADKFGYPEIAAWLRSEQAAPPMPPRPLMPPTPPMPPRPSMMPTIPTMPPRPTMPTAPMVQKKQKNPALIVLAVLAVVVAVIVVGYVMITSRASPDMAWYTENAGAADFTVSTAEELFSFAQIVNGAFENPKGGRRTAAVWKKGPARSSFVGKTVTLSGDIDLSQYDNWVPIGDYTSDSNSVFSGTFDGGGHAIRNLRINRQGAERQGLFGRIDGGKVQNLGLDGVRVRGHSRVGGVAGVINAQSVILGCYANGEISGTSMVGGIVGTVADTSAVMNSYSSAAVAGDAAVGGVAGWVNASSGVGNSYSTGTVKGRLGVGGVVGSLFDNSRVDKSCFLGSVLGSDEVGGVVGQVLSKSRAANSYSTGSVSGGGIVGGVAGSVFNESSVSSSYSSAPVTGTGNSVGGVVGSIDKKSRVTGCAALNPYVRGLGINAGRVVGGLAASTISNNAAFLWMANSAGTTEWGDDGASFKDGVGIDAAAILRNGTVGGRFTAANGWTVKNGSLPGIGKTVVPPPHLQ